jgi:Uma2 family endonuclease
MLAVPNQGLSMLKTLTAPRRRIGMIGPQDDGCRMSLAAFDHIDGQEGYLYELNKGVIEVTNIPHRRHFAILKAIRNQLVVYEEMNPRIIHAVGEASDTKVLIESEQSERHPDISVYTSPMPDVDEIWSIWVPTITVEVVSENSIKRDYEEKPGDYLAFGISEYWIVDGLKKQMTVMTRFRGGWKDKSYKPSQKYTTRHLPGFTLDLKRVFGSAK